MLLLHFDGHYSRQDNGISEFYRWTLWNYLPKHLQS
jgi:hypothetical protein